MNRGPESVCAAMKLKDLIRDLVNDARVDQPDRETRRAADFLRRLIEAKEWGELDAMEDDAEIAREIDRCKDLIVAQYLREHAG